MLNSLIFVLDLIDVDLQMLQRLANVDLAFEILLSTSDVESPLLFCCQSTHIGLFLVYRVVKFDGSTNVGDNLYHFGL
jgi:hypothetical protein